MIAGSLGILGVGMGGLDSRPVLGGTGLIGRFDLDITFVREARSASAAGSAADVEAPVPTFEEASKTQAGLRMLKQVGAVKVSIVDRGSAVPNQCFGEHRLQITQCTAAVCNLRCLVVLRATPAVGRGRVQRS